MKFCNISILLGYTLILFLVVVIGYVYYQEEHTLAMMDNENRSTNRLRQNINELNLHMTTLSLLGETVVEWDKEDREYYHKYRMRIDSALNFLSQIFTSEAVNIDSLRTLLGTKEEKLCDIVEIYQQQKNISDEMANKFPVIVRQSIYDNPQKLKRKGFLGIFGKKEESKLTSAMTMLHSFNQELMEQHEVQNNQLKVHLDSLSQQNRLLNMRMQNLINYLDRKAQENLWQREQEIAVIREQSYRDIGVLTAFILFMLLLSYVIIHRDMYHRNKNRRKLEESIKQNKSLLEMRKKIILTISHDIRGPLNAISGSAELAMDIRDKKRRNTHLNNIQITCKHVVHLLNNLLDMYRLNEAKEVRNDVSFTLHDLLERTASNFSHVVNNKGILFRCDFKDTEVKLYGDVDRIEQIIDNLLTNAVKFTESGTIDFNVRYHNRELIIEVKDTGIGMSEETLARIFRPFERQSSAANSNGFGLGLPITQGLVNLLGGAIKVTSSIEQGSTFQVTLPMQETDKPIESENRILLHVAHLPKKVLVIDDDRMLQDVIKEMLERNGVSCTTCSTAKEVVNAIRSKDYDLLLSDIQMSGTNGFDLLTLLRNSTIGNSRTIPVIAMTARGDKEKKTYLDAGFTACIYKPFSSSELLSLFTDIKGCRPDENQGIDFSTMLSEINDKVKLLYSFIGQSKRDAEELASAADSGDREKLRETAHRMQPMWELLQMEGTLLAYRTLLKDNTAGDDAVREYTRQIIEYTAMLIAEAENEIKRLTNETENIDS
ncbi:ATP-binding protein [Phocaeicola vulgatus]|uniref:ATP-binding protein n=1 Tax=Bacteroidaceae TaxID=815 RepID=UPI0018979F0D